jgi:hypothetical protein
LFSLCLLLLLLFSVFVQKEEWLAGEEKQVTSIAECNAKKKKKKLLFGFNACVLNTAAKGKLREGTAKSEQKNTNKPTSKQKKEQRKKPTLAEVIKSLLCYKKKKERAECDTG